MTVTPEMIATQACKESAKEHGIMGGSAYDCALRAARLALASQAQTVPIQYRHDEGGFVEFINRDGPYIVRDIPSPAAILADMETRQVIGYRVYDPDTAAHVEPVAWATIPKVPGGLRWTTDIKAQAERWQADGHKLAPLYEQPPQPKLVHVGFQWRARLNAGDLWSPWRDGLCPALAPKGSETEERRVYALAAEGSDNG